jgi:hypothetical protein
MRLTCVTVALLASVGCSLGVDPGEYSAASRAPGSAGEFLLIGGQRAASVDLDPRPTTDVLRVVLDARGAPAAVTAELSLPANGAFAAARVKDASGDRVLVIGESTGNDRTSYVAAAPSRTAELGPWTFSARPDPPRWNAALLLSPPSILQLGGGEQEHGVPGAAVVASDLTIDPPGASTWRDAGTSLGTPRWGPAVARVGPFVYAVGGTLEPESNPKGVSAVEVARVDDATGRPGAFAATTALPETRASTTLAGGAGRLFAIGGTATGLTNEVLDVILSAPIDAATGALGAWSQAGRLAAPVSEPAAIVVAGRLFVVGGYVAGARRASDRVASARISADGTLDAWEPDAAVTLPAGYVGQIAVAP